MLHTARFHSNETIFHNVNPSNAVPTAVDKESANSEYHVAFTMQRDAAVLSSHATLGVGTYPSSLRYINSSSAVVFSVPSEELFTRIAIPVADIMDTDK